MAKKNNDCGTDIPQQVIDSLAYCLLPDIQKFFESEEGKKEFEEWKKQQASDNDTKEK